MLPGAPGPPCSITTVKGGDPYFLKWFTVSDDFSPEIKGPSLDQKPLIFRPLFYDKRFLLLKSTELFLIFDLQLQLQEIDDLLV